MTKVKLHDRGGKREGAGRPAKPPTQMIRVDKRLVASVIKLKQLLSDNNVIGVVVSPNDTAQEIIESEINKNIESTIIAIKPKAKIVESKIISPLSASNTEQTTNTINKINIQDVIIELTGFSKTGSQKQITAVAKRARDAVLNGATMTDSNKHLIVKWLRNEYISLLTHKVIYCYEFAGGNAEIFANGQKYFRREKLTGKPNIGKWEECFFISIVESDGVLFIDTDSGQHLLTSTGQRSRR